MPVFDLPFRSIKSVQTAMAEYSRPIFNLTIALSAYLLTHAQVLGEETSKIEAKETVSYSIPKAIKVEFSPDGKRFAAIQFDVASRMAVVLFDGKNRWLHKDIVECADETCFQFSKNSRRIAYVVDAEPGQAVAVDGKVGVRHDAILYNTLMFSPDSQHVAYGARHDGKYVMVIDGVVGPAFDKLMSTAQFSSDGKHVAYVGRRGEKSHVVIDGELSDGFNQILANKLSFSPDGRRLGYIAARQSRWHVFDGAIVKEYEHMPNLAAIQPVRYSADSSQASFTAGRGDQLLTIIRDAAGNDHEVVEGAHTVFSPDSKRYAYAQRRGKKWAAVVSGKAGPEFDSVALIMFDPTSRYAVYMATRGDKWVTVADGSEGREYDALSGDSLTFSASGKRFAYVARTGKLQHIVLDGEEGPKFEGITDRGIVFSHDEAHLAYVAKEGKKVRVIVDGLASAEYDDIFPPMRFSEDNQSFEFLGRRSFNVYKVVLKVPVR